jgi:outer membrane protein
MKKIILATASLLLMGTAVMAQKYAYIDSEYILKNIPEYETAQQKLDDMSMEWQKEIEKKYEEIEKLVKAYQAESVLLPDDLKKKREEEIIAKEKEAKDLQKKRFGKDGELFKKRQELIKPIQDKIYNAIEEIATLKSYAFVFDKSGSLTIMYADPKFDISDDVLKKIGNVKRE